MQPSSLVPVCAGLMYTNQSVHFCFSTRPLLILLQHVFSVSVFTLYYRVRVHSHTCRLPRQLPSYTLTLSSLLLYTSSFCVSLSKWLISEAGLPFSPGDSENTQDLTMTDDSPSARCLNQGQSAFFLLSLSMHTHTQNN